MEVLIFRCPYIEIDGGVGVHAFCCYPLFLPSCSVLSTENMHQLRNAAISRTINCM